MAGDDTQKKPTYDVVVWGASGFTGKLVTEYLAERYGTNRDLSWAIAGRNEAKLESLRSELGTSASNLPLIVSDSFDSEATIFTTSIGG